MCGLIADSYIRQALVYSAHPSCSPSVFLHTLPLNILLWKNPLRRYRPLLLSVLKIRCQDHLYNPLPSVLAFLLALAPPPSTAAVPLAHCRLFTQHQFINLPNFLVCCDFFLPLSPVLSTSPYFSVWPPF